MTRRLQYKSYGGSKKKRAAKPYINITTRTGSVDSEGDFCLTPNTYLSEVDGEINLLIKELEEIRKSAKKKLEALQAL